MTGRASGPLHRLGIQLVISHVLVALVSLAAAGLLVVALAPTLFDRLGVEEHGTGPGRGVGQGLRLQVVTAIQQALVWGTLAGLVAAVALGVLAARRVTKPVTALREATHRLAEGNYATELPTPGTTELAGLVDDVGTLATRLAETERRRVRLLGEVGHEMRTPLTVIDSQVEAMIDGVVPASEENLAQLATESRRLHRLSNDLSSLSRAEENRFNLEPADVDLSALTSRVAQRLRPQAADAGIDLIVRSNLELTTRADPDRVSQVVTNLIGNSIRATPPGGRIEVSSQADGQWAVITVSDTGEGIAADDLERIFERFYRVPGRRGVGNEGGSGIGLTIARHLAEAHGGTLRATSDGPGAGASFTLRLPLTATGTTFG